MTGSRIRMGDIPWPPLIYLGGLVAGVLLGIAYPSPWFQDLLAALLFAIGWVALAAVVALWVTAIRAMIAARTTLHPGGIPERLLTSGPFSVSRNPIYLANTLFLIAIGLIAGNAWLILMAFVAAFATRKLVIEREEWTLAEKFGKKYRDYARRVRRWV